MKQLLEKLLRSHDHRSFLPSPVPVDHTPIFVLDQKTFVSRLTELQDALKRFSFSSKIAYSFKTNYDLPKIGLVKKYHLLAETVSTHEYTLAKKLKFTDNSIIINGPNKGNLAPLLQKNLLIHLDNFAELDELTSLASKIKISASIGLRLRTSVVKSRFGFDIDNGEAHKALDILNSLNIPLSSIHIHLGSDVFYPQLYQQSAVAIGQFLSGNFLTPSTIDFGGGFPAHGATPYGQKPQKISSIYSYVKAISYLFDQLNYSPTLVLEPGRYLIDDAITLYSKIVNISSNSDSQILTLDTTINMLPSLWYRPATISIFNSDFTIKKGSLTPTTIFGSSCQEHDLLYHGKLPICQIGDIITFQAVGAYNQSMAPDFIFPAPQTILV
jgi:diaminopimelate decarboxylase